MLGLALLLALALGLGSLRLVVSLVRVTARYFLTGGHKWVLYGSFAKGGGSRLGLGLGLGLGSGRARVRCLVVTGEHTSRLGLGLGFGFEPGGSFESGAGL